MRTETITVFGDPKGKARPRFSHGHAYTPKTTREYEKLFADAWGENKMFDGPIKVFIKAIFSPPASTTKANRARMLSGDIFPTKKPDIDNVAKAVLDGLNGVAFADDCQVVNLQVVKSYGAFPSVSVRISEEVR